MRTAEPEFVPVDLNEFDALEARVVRAERTLRRAKP